MQFQADTKTCTRCNEAKPLDRFLADVRYKHGVTSWCKDCKRNYVREYDVRRAHSPKASITSKKCTLCGEEKTAESFGRTPHSKSGLKARCKDCRRKAESHAGLPVDEVARIRAENRLRSIYGLSLEDYDLLYQSQNGLCVICGGPFKIRPVVDHCHATGKVRGLLCNSCNVGVGHIEKPGFVERVQQYLRERA